MVLRWEEAKTKTRCVFACWPKALVIYLYRGHERTYENISRGGFIERKREGVKVFFILRFALVYVLRLCSRCIITRMSLRAVLHVFLVMW